MKLQYSVVAIVLLCCTLALAADDIPEKARKYMARGEAAIEVAKDASDYAAAVREFQTAVQHAPQWANAYFNLGLAQEQAGNFEGAIASFNKYMSLAPGASDIETVQTKIYKLEYKMENAKRLEVKKEQERSLKVQELVSRLSGNWIEEDETATHYFQLSYSGANHFVVRYSRSKHIHAINSSILFKQADVTVNDDLSIQGTATFWMDFRPYLPKELPPREEPIRGRVSDDGFQMVFQGREPMFGFEDYTGEYRDFVRTLKRQ